MGVKWGRAKRKKKKRGVKKKKERESLVKEFMYY